MIPPKASVTRKGPLAFRVSECPRGADTNGYPRPPGHRNPRDPGGRHNTRRPAMTITQYRDRLHRLTADLRRARFNGDLDEIDRIETQLDEALDEYNRSKPCSD